MMSLLDREFAILWGHTRRSKLKLSEIIDRAQMETTLLSMVLRHSIM